MLLTAQGITKIYGGVHALRGVTFQVEPGEVHGLLGPNGAGKSTLIKVIAGLVRPDDGELTWSAAEADVEARADLGLVMQESELCQTMTVAENILLGSYPVRIPGVRLLDGRAMRRAAREHLEMLHVDISPDAPVASLSLAERRIVEVAKALARKPRLLILDEPTTALGASEVDDLLSLTRRVANRGVSVIFVTHRLNEIVAACDRVTVLRDGATVGTLRSDEISVPTLLAMISGEGFEELVHDRATPGEPRLEVEALTGPGFRDVGFTVRARECAVITGLVGSGRSSVLRALVGLVKSKGHVTVDGKPLAPRSLRVAKARGVRFLPEDRADGLVPGMSVQDNLVLSVLASGRLARWSLFRRRQARAIAQELVERFGIKAADLGQQIEQLSGGNQRKVMLAAGFATQPRTLLIDEPTQGVDVAAKADIHRIVLDFRSAGGSVVAVTSEMEEGLDLADRFLVMRSGQLAGDVPAHEATRAELTRLAFGDG